MHMFPHCCMLQKGVANYYKAPRHFFVAMCSGCEIRASTVLLPQLQKQNIRYYFDISARNLQFD